MRDGPCPEGPRGLAEGVEEDALLASQPKHSPAPDPTIDRRRDERFGLVEIGGQRYYTSEVLFAVDADAYRALASDDLDEEDPR